MAKFPDLNRMTLKELEALRSDLDQAIRNAQQGRKAEALKAAEQAAKSFGFRLAELTKGSRSKSPRTKSALPPKYRHPENREVTWSGRGRRPAWIIEGLASGKNLEDFAI